MTNYHTYHETTNPGEPYYMPEFQGTFATLMLDICADALACCA